MFFILLIFALKKDFSPKSQKAIIGPSRKKSDRNYFANYHTNYQGTGELFKHHRISVNTGLIISFANHKLLSTDRQAYFVGKALILLSELDK